MKEFSTILKELRTKEKLSQEALGNIIHVSRSSVAKYENGLGLPSEDVINALCDYFKVDKNYLFPKENVEKLEEYKARTDSPLNNILVGLLYIQKGEKTTGITVLDDFCDKEKNLLVTVGVKNYIKKLTKELN